MQLNELIFEICRILSKIKSPIVFSVSGDPGAGKTSFYKEWFNRYIFCKLGAESVRFSYFSGGTFFREKHRISGFRGSFEEYTKDVVSVSPHFDTELDAALLESMVTSVLPGLVADGRLAFHFARQALEQNTGLNVFSAYFAVDPTEGARRMLGDAGKNETRIGEAGGLISEKALANTTRNNADQTRYLGLYRVDIFDFLNYDLRIDTTDLMANDVFFQAMLAFLRKLQEWSGE